jgi:hypothetical protein
MQKIEFLYTLEAITKRLKTDKIVEIFKNGFNHPGNGYDYGQLKPILFESKSQYDQNMLDEQLSDFLKNNIGINIYEEKNMSILTSVLQPTNAAGYSSNLPRINFWCQ